ncbi:hypothetical protein Tco_0264752 [Tanacetum coccineum]
MHSPLRIIYDTVRDGYRCQYHRRDTIAQTRFESVSKHSNDSLLARDEEITLVSVHDVNVSADEEVKEYNIVAYTQRFNELALMCLRMVEPERVKVDAYIRRLTDNIKGEVTSSKPANLHEAMSIAHKLMEHKSQAKDEIILEGKKQKWESFQSGNSSVKSNHKDNLRQTLQNNQKQGNARAMVTAPTDGKVSSGSLPLCERCFTRHVKQEEVGEVHGRAYAIKDAKPKGPNVVTGTFLLNNRYAFVLFDLGSDRSFMDTRFSSMLNIDPVKIRASYEDAKKLLEAIEKRFGGNAATRKTQRNILKKQYENFTAPSSEMLDQTFDRLQKLWNTHAVVWRNKADLDTMSMDDLYNNLKMYEPEVKRMSSSSSSTQNMAFASSSNNNTSSTNEAVDTSHEEGSLLLMAMRLLVLISPKWSATTATRGDIFLGSAELQEIKTSDQADEWPNYTLMAFSSSSPDSEVSNDSICSKSCLETVELLKSQNDLLLKDLKKSELMVLGYTTGLESVEEKLEVYKVNDSIYLQDIKGLKFEIHIGEITIREIRKKLEIVQKEKDGIQLNVNKFEHASKSLNKLIECQIVDNCKKGLGYENYNAVPPPYTGNFMPLTHDLSFNGLDEFVNEPVVENSKAVSSEEEPKVVRKCDDAPSIEECVLDNEEEDVSQPKIKKKIVRPSIVKKEFVKSKQQEKISRKTVKQVEQHRQNTHSPRGNQRNWNNMMSQKLGSNLRCLIRPIMCVKDLIICRVNHQNFAKKTHPCAKKNMVPRAVLMKSGLVSINTARQNISKTSVLVNIARQVNTAHSKTTVNAARPMSYLSKTAHSTVKSQDKYVAEILKKFGFTEVKTASTPIETQKPFLKDEDGEEVDVHMYRLMIGSLMYLTSLRSDIMFAVCACARYQVNPKVLHLHAVKRVFSDYAGASLDRKSTTGVDGNKVIITESTVRRDLQLEDEEGVDCLPNATIFEQLALMGFIVAAQGLEMEGLKFAGCWVMVMVQWESDWSRASLMI